MVFDEFSWEGYDYPQPKRRRRLRYARPRYARPTQLSVIELWERRARKAKRAAVKTHKGYKTVRKGIGKIKKEFAKRKPIYTTPKNGVGSKLKGIFKRKKGLYD